MQHIKLMSLEKEENVPHPPSSLSSLEILIMRRSEEKQSSEEKGRKEKDKWTGMDVISLHFHFKEWLHCKGVKII